MTGQQRCSFCPKPSIAGTSSIYGGRTTYRCGDHPPDDAPKGRCDVCGRGFWPDFLHLDCDAGAVSVRAGRMVDEEARRHSDRQLREDRERLTRTLRSLVRWLRGGR